MHQNRYADLTAYNSSNSSEPKMLPIFTERQVRSLRAQYLKLEKENKEIESKMLKLEIDNTGIWAALYALEEKMKGEKK